MKIYTYITICVLAAIADINIASAQYFSLGDDPARARWMSIKTPSYDIIYPAGHDSLATSYAAELERYRPAVHKGPALRMPVVLHPYSVTANGMVMWAPSRMELLTTPSAYDPDIIPWETQLAVHETRHIAHINNFRNGVFKPFGWIFGQQAAGAFFGLFQNTYMYEGDAVTTETALTKGGRGRSGDFTAYMAASFAEGDFRNRDRWICGSYRHYTPDNYVYGYMFNSSNILSSGNFDYYAEILEKIRKRPYIPWINDLAYRKTLGRSKTELHRDMVEMYTSLWDSLARLRNPVTESDRIVRTPRRYTEYGQGVMGGDNRLYYVKWSLHRPHSLVSIDPETGKEEYVRAFSFNAGRLASGGDRSRIYWTEYRSHYRWSLEQWSDLYCYDTGSGRTRRLTKGDRLFNVGVSDDGSRLVCNRYGSDGKYFLVIIDAGSGEETASIRVPEGIRFTENIWCGDRIFSLGISGDGMGIYGTEFNEGAWSGKWEIVREPSGCHLSEIGTWNDEIVFVSDRDGVSNLYALGKDGREWQICSVPFGGKSYIFGDGDDKLYVSSLSSEGWLPQVCEPQRMEAANGIFYPVAEKLEEMAAGCGYIVGDSADVSICAPERFRKVPNLFRFHSWAPFYYDVDNVRNMSFDNIQQVAAPGLTLMSQNTLGTAVGRLGYAYRNGRHGAVADFTYSGLFPVFELKFRYNERGRTETLMNFAALMPQATSTEMSQGYIYGSVRAYVPFVFNRCGWYSGLVPQIGANLGNDIYRIKYRDAGKVNEDEYGYFGSVNAAVRYYRMTSTAVSGVYPRLGFGAELGYVGVVSARKWINDVAYAYAYGYLPSFLNHGIRISVMHALSVGQKRLSLSGVNLSPRGMVGLNPVEGTLATVDYAAPVHLGDISIPGTLYLKRAVITPFADVYAQEMLVSAGADIKIGFRIFNLPYDIEAGARLAYNSGNLPSGIGKIYAGFLFNVDFE